MELLVFVRIGVRVEMADGSWWFQSKKGSWTHHFTDMERDPFDDSLLRVERKDTYSPHKLRREWGGEPGFMEALDEAENRDYFDSRTWSWAEISANRTFTCRRVARRDRMMSEIVQSAATNIEATLPMKVAITPSLTACSTKIDCSRCSAVVGRALPLSFV